MRNTNVLIELRNYYSSPNFITTKKQSGEWKWGVDEKTELNES
jgi:hypothetical protein